VRITPLALGGVHRIDLEPFADERGFFARSYCVRELAAAGIEAPIVQTSLSWNPRRGTLRGLHWQAPPDEETKIVRCARGRIHDVLVDLRPDSPTYLRHVAVELSGEERNAVVVPPGVAHGFLTLEDGCEVHYAMSAFHAPASARGARWNDPAFGISWPAAVEVVSERDRGWPDFAPPTSAP
jgi:dTDP-4-dehydrorhamnose 3,5-epimerase